MTIIFVANTTAIADTSLNGPLSMDEQTVYTNRWGPVPRSVFVNTQLVDATLPPGITGDNYDWVGKYEWDPATQTVIKLYVPADPQAVTDTIAKTYTDFDALFNDGSKTGRRIAADAPMEQAARAYAASGYDGVPPDYVSTYATTRPEGELTAPQAATAIIERADFLRGVQKTLYLQQMQTIFALQTATIQDEVDAARTGWNNAVLEAKYDLGLLLRPSGMIAEAPAL